MVLTEVEKVTVVAIVGYEDVAEGCFECDEDYDAHVVRLAGRAVFLPISDMLCLSGI
jgi:hypothetical protein